MAAKTFTIDGNTTTGKAAELHFLNWFLSLATEGMIEEDRRNALTAVAIFQGAYKGSADDARLVALSGVTIA